MLEIDPARRFPAFVGGHAAVDEKVIAEIEPLKDIVRGNERLYYTLLLNSLRGELKGDA